MIIGKGSYGQVSVRNGFAVKKFNRLSHLVQEYIALRYLRPCNYIVKPISINIEKLELHMELYDGSLRDWIRKNRRVTLEEFNFVLQSILKGLVELHDRNLVHGDLKPSNILIRNRPFTVVLGDCGFVSVGKYSKVSRTAAAYREPVINGDYAHDMYSFGIFLDEMLRHFKIGNSRYHKLASDLIRSDRRSRPTARYVLEKMFNIYLPLWDKPQPDISAFGISQAEKKNIKLIMRDITNKYNINRGKIGYLALLCYLEKQRIPANQYPLLISLTVLILSALFGPSGFTEDHINRFCKTHISTRKINSELLKLMNNNDFLNALFI